MFIFNLLIVVRAFIFDKFASLFQINATMKKLLLFSALVCSTVAEAQLSLINEGVNVVINNGIDLRVEQGNVVNTSGSISNDGNIYLDLNYSGAGAYTGGSSSWLWFEGSGTQYLMDLVSISRLRVDNGQRLLLNGDLEVTGDLDLSNNGNIELGNHTLSMSPTASLLNYDGSNFIRTTGTGSLKRSVSAASVAFPVGNTTYNPAFLSNAGVADVFSVRVVDEILEEGTSGSPQTSDIVNRTWHIDEALAGGSDVNLALQWTDADELPSFNAAACQVIHYNVSQTKWEYLNTPLAATALGGGVKQQSMANVSSFSPFGVDDNTLNLPIELLSFRAKRTSASLVGLNWQTATELNNEGFVVERMLGDAGGFESIGFVKGAGTSVRTQNYSFIDKNSYAGVSYYRLKQEDVDGESSYTEVRAVSGSEFLSKLEGAVKVYPNPVASWLEVGFEGLPKGTSAGVLDIYSIGGRLLQRKSVVLAKDGVVRVTKLSALPKGAYLLQLRLQDGRSYSAQFIKE